MTVSLYSKLHNPQDTDPIQRFVERFDGDSIDERWLITILRGTGNVTMVDAIDEGLNLLADGPQAPDLKTKISFGSIRAFSNTGAVMIGIWRVVEIVNISSKMALINVSPDGPNTNFIQTIFTSNFALQTNDGATTTTVLGSVYNDANFHRHEIEITPTRGTLKVGGILEATSTTNLPTLNLEPTFQVNSKLTATQRNMRVRYVSVYNT